MTWRELEREIVEILREHKLAVLREHGEAYLRFDYDLPMTFNLTTLAKDLARRLERRT